MVICFGAYWAWQSYKNSKTNETATDQKDVDELELFYQKQIDEIESKSKEEMAKHEGLLLYYKSQLEKINKIKNK